MTLPHEALTVSVVGLGYIGLPTAALIASRGTKVIGIDVKADVVETINKGSIHISEPDLDGLVQKVVSNGKLVASTTPSAADVFVVAVPTPIDDEKKPVMDLVFAATRAIAPVLKAGNLVILESTSPVGSTEQMAEIIAEMRPDLKVAGRTSDNTPDIHMAYCPERVLPGRILTELVNNDRCIGGLTPMCARKAQRFYKMFVRGACITTTARTAELIKLTENAFRDTNIAFANELSLICDKFGISVWDVIDLANRHPRVNILRPGPGVGGHCIAVDPWFIVHSAPEIAHVIKTSREVNDRKVTYTFNKASELIDEHSYADIACLGLAFKPNVDDLRESPALEVAEKLAHKYGKRLKVVEPYIHTLPEEISKHGATLVNLEDALSTCEVAILLVDHDEFKMVPLAERRHLAVYDTRGIWRDMVGL